MKANTVSLSDVCEINPTADCKFQGESPCTFVPMEAVDEWSARITSYATRPFREVSKGYTKFAENDVLLAKITPCMENGKCALARGLRDGVGFGTTEFHILRASEKVLPEWLYHFWRYPKTRQCAERAMTGSAGQKRVPPSYLETLKVPLPHLSEQKRITKLLEQADHLRRKRRYTLELSDTILPAAFLHLFGEPVKNPRGWPKVELLDACENITDGTHDTPDRVACGVPFITSKNIRPFEFDFTDLDFVTAETHREIIKRCNPRYGDVLYTNIGVNVGNAVANRLRFEFSLKNVALIQPNFDKLHTSFLEALLNDASFKEDILRVSSVGGAQKFVSLEVLRGILVFMPPFLLQQQFSVLVERVERLRAVQRESLRQAEHLFQTLLHQAFTEGI